MSGGHFDYVGFRLQESIQEIAKDPKVQKRWPDLAKTLDLLSQWIYDVEHAIDWDLSGDTGIADDADFEAEALERLFLLAHGIWSENHEQ